MQKPSDTNGSLKKEATSGMTSYPQFLSFVSNPSRRMVQVALIGIILLGTWLRWHDLATLPPGLYQDEAAEALDALRILDGELPIYFETNNGREPAFMYLLAGGIALLGRSPFALRMVAAALGILTIPITYQAVQILFGKRTALLAAFILATALWPIHLSRLALRVTMLPAILGLGAWALVRAWRRDTPGTWTWAGVLLGLSLYTYLPARFVLAVPLGVAVVASLSGANWRKLARGGMWLLLGYGLVALPLVIYAIGHWEVVNGRAGQVSILTPAIQQGQLLATLSNQGLQIAKMFLVQGDANLRHNVPSRPVFDGFMGVACVVGLAVSLRHWRQKRWQWAWLWLFIFLLPTLLSDSAPHFLRAYGVWPFLAVWPAVGVAQMGQWVRRKMGDSAAAGLIILLLGGSLSSTVYSYFGTDYLTSRAAYNSFDAFATDLALAVNQFTGTGWQGGERRRPQGEVWIDPRLYHFTETVEFLIPHNPEMTHGPVHLWTPEAPPILPRGRGLRLVLFPGEEVNVLPLLPPTVYLTLQDGAWAKADTPGSPLFLLFRTLTIEPVTAPPTPIACFAGGVELVQAHISQDRIGVTAELAWRATVDAPPAYTIFFHLYQNGFLVGQQDSLPANGLLPFPWLRAGDISRDPRVVLVDPDVFGLETGQVGVGLYDAATGQRATATNCVGQALGDEVMDPSP